MARIDWKREGDDYSFDLRNGVVISVTRLSEEPSGLFGEMTVRYVNAMDGGLVHSARVNLMSTQTRQAVVKACSLRHPAQSLKEWQDAIEHVCFVTKEKYREGVPVIDLSTVPEREGTRWLLEPFIEQNAATILFGDGDSGKTNTAIAMVASVATGCNVIGRLHGKPLPVMILDWEDDEYTHAERLRAICRGADVTMPKVLYRRMTASLHESATAIRRDIDRHGIGLVLIDSVGLAKGGEPESADASLRLFAAARSLKVPLLMIDHISKGGMSGDAKKTPYGSVYTRNSARQAWYVEKAVGAEPLVIDVSLTHTKANHGVRIDPIAYEMRFLNDEHGNAVAIFVKRIEAASVPEFAESMSIPSRILYEIEHAGRPTLTNKELAERLGIDVEKVKPATSRLAKKGVLVAMSRNGQYEYGRAYQGASE